MEISREILTRVTILDISVILMYIIGIVALAQNFRKVSIRFVRFFVLIGITHLFFTFVYYFYTLNNVADSIGYYRRTLYWFDSWGETFGQGTTFIYFTLYPLIKYLGLTYFGSFFIYSFIGLFGFYYLVKVLIDIVKESWSNWFYLLLLPNLHFWTVATGKDSLIFFGISLLTYVSYFQKSWKNYLFPIIFIGFVRSHILLFILIAFGFSQLVLNKKIKLATKIAVFIVSLGAFYLLIPIVLDRIGFVDTESILSQLESLESQKMEGTTSIDMTDKNIIIKWLSYMFRPFFYDAKGVLALLASVENLLWVALFIKIFYNARNKFSEAIKNFYWFCFFAIFFVTIPAAYILVNLGIALRQKMMVFPFIIVIFFIGLESKKNGYKNT